MCSSYDNVCFKGDFHLLPPKVQRFVAEKAELMRPRGIYICDGTEHESEEIVDKLVERGMLAPLKAYHNNFICRTDPKVGKNVVGMRGTITLIGGRSSLLPPSGKI